MSPLKNLDLISVGMAIAGILVLGFMIFFSKLKSGKQRLEKLKSGLQKTITKHLLKENSEFRKTYNKIGNRILPKIIFWPYEHPAYFKPGGKQKWVIKNTK